MSFRKQVFTKQKGSAGKAEPPQISISHLRRNLDRAPYLGSRKALTFLNAHFSAHRATALSSSGTLQLRARPRRGSQDRTGTWASPHPSRCRTRRHLERGILGRGTKSCIASETVYLKWRMVPRDSPVCTSFSSLSQIPVKRPSAPLLSPPQLVFLCHAAPSPCGARHWSQIGNCAASSAVEYWQ